MNENKIINLALLDVNTLTRNLKFDQVETEIYQNLGKTFKGYTGNDVTPNQIGLVHKDVVKGIKKATKLDETKIENVLVKMSTGNEAMIDIRYTPDTNVRFITPRNNFWANYTDNIVKK